MQMQRTILWVIFTMSLVLLWDAWQRHQGGPGMFASAPKVEQQVAAGPTPAAGAPSAAVDGGSVPSGGSVPGAAGAQVGTTPAEQPGIGEKQRDLVSLHNDLVRLDIDLRGAAIVRGELLAHREADSDSALQLLSSQPGRFYVAQNGFINAPAGARYPTHVTPFKVVDGATDHSITLVASEGGLRVERRMELKPGSYIVDVSDTITNEGSAPASPVLYRQLTRDNHKPSGDTQFFSTFAGPVIYTEAQKFQKIQFDDVLDGSAKHATEAADGWAGIIQHHFASAWLPPDGVQRTFYTQPSGPNLISVGYKQPLGEIAPGEQRSTNARLFLGPQDQKLLAKIAPGLDLTVDYGFLTIIAKPLWWLLETLHGLVGNWGWAIVLLTLIVKTIFFPLQAASYKSMARMKAVAPRLTALREKYGDDRVQLNQKMMELYKNEKINPLGGCLPILVQIPVFISLYWVLQGSVEMRDAPWIGWIRDLASPDPYYVLPLLMAISMFVQTKLNPTPPDPVQAKVMMFMPIVFSVMFFFFPAGLVLYWLVNNLYSIAQQWVITRKIVKSH
ncbi:MAG: membrane protein insertase YidC [Burkholderiaceae bacterium]